MDKHGANRRQTAFAFLRWLHLPPLLGLSKLIFEIWTDGSALGQLLFQNLTGKKQLFNYFPNRQPVLSLLNNQPNYDHNRKMLLSCEGKQFPKRLVPLDVTVAFIHSLRACFATNHLVHQQHCRRP